MRRFVSVVLILAFAALVSPTPLVLAQQGTGNVNGVATDASKNPLPDHTVRIRNVSTRQLTSTTTTGADGAFNFSNLPPGDYVIEVVNSAGNIVASSTSVAVVAGQTVAVSVTASALAAAAAATTTGGLLGMSTTALVVGSVVVGGIAAAAVIANNDSSPSR